ncbi:alpha/beta hydrolase [Lacibacter sediminis]|uniref:Alpha/beta hydrolase n=1 Tax=Lacibacter sediminis TaxID=2760713 RepID=A0A7G5XBT7_9BACT|nr:alpha/beta hydrolase [Lacibacter sediminis]QNA42940.1 alpha/beta hydrolase [Lacibacter sediminis]
MKNIIGLVLNILFIKFSFAQTPAEFFYKGDSLYGAKDYKNSALAYAEGIRGKGNDAVLFRYSFCAALWSLANIPDSAFHYLEIISRSDKLSNADVDGIKNDNSFNAVKKDKRWQLIIEKIYQQAKKNSFPQVELIYGKKDGMGLTLVWIKPKVRSNGKAIIHVQSGAWISLSFSNEIQTELVHGYLKKGYSVFVVMHGSQPRYAIPDAINDLKRAVRYIRFNAGKFGIDPNKIGATGFSSGGHLSLILGMADAKIDSLANDPVDRVSSKVQAVAVLYPPTDFLNWGKDSFDILQDKNLIKNVRIGEAFNFRNYDRRARTLNSISDSVQRNKIMKEISPIYSITSDDPPVFIIHGDADGIVPLQQSVSFNAKLKEAGVANKLIVKKGVGHGIEDMLPEYYQFSDWFDKYLR